MKAYTEDNYQPKKLFGEIKVFNVPPYSLLVDKNKVNEINLDPPSSNKLFWMDFDIKEK